MKIERPERAETALSCHGQPISGVRKFHKKEKIN
jgi:hypothetical protein